LENEENVFDYINSIDKATCSIPASPLPRYGDINSNIVESGNALFLDARKTVFFGMIENFMHSIFY
jgi:hypothetical protein